MRTLAEAQQAFKSLGVNKDQQALIDTVGDMFENALETIYVAVPESADRTAGVRKLLEAKWTFIQAITHPAAQNYAKSA
jgi:hypothetical protein